jgi:hypothetical protein
MGAEYEYAPAGVKLAIHPEDVYHVVLFTHLKSNGDALELQSIA